MRALAPHGTGKEAKTPGRCRGFRRDRPIRIRGAGRTGPPRPERRPQRQPGAAGVAIDHGVAAAGRGVAFPVVDVGHAERLEDGMGAMVDLRVDIRVETHAVRAALPAHRLVHRQLAVEQARQLPHVPGLVGGEAVAVLVLRDAQGMAGRDLPAGRRSLLTPRVRSRAWRCLRCCRRRCGSLRESG